MTVKSQAAQLRCGGEILVSKTWIIVVDYFNWVDLKAFAREELNTAPVT